jgi:hypothetical protein
MGIQKSNGGLRTQGCEDDVQNVFLYSRCWKDPGNVLAEDLCGLIHV